MSVVGVGGRSRPGEYKSLKNNVATSSAWNTQRKVSAFSHGRPRHETRLQASSMPMSNLAVRLDEPLLSPAAYRRPSSVAVFKYILSVFLSDAFKFAVVAFLIAFVTSILARSELTAPKNLLSKAGGSVASVFRWVRAPFLRLADGIASKRAVAAIGPPVPMTFDGDGGWGVCTYLGAEPVGGSGYVKHEFGLPSKDNVLPLTLGQHIALCCLDNDDNVVQGEFYPYSERTQQGTFSVLLPSGKNMERDENELGLDRAGVSRVLKGELEVGDEIAIKPGGLSLEYRGQYLPVKEMVFLSSGEGIVPVLEQVRAVLPEGSSSVQLVSVLWLCENTKDFDIADTQLEAEYRKFPSKLAVTCVDDDLRKGKMEDNKDIVEAIPEFLPGTMAIVTGPRSFRRKAKNYLLNQGYPSDTICVME